MLPELNPITAPDAYCAMCAKKMEIKLDKGPNGRLQKIIYKCVNEKSGCDYQVEHDIRLTGWARASH